jgi:hypothetical protein
MVVIMAVLANRRGITQLLQRQQKGLVVSIFSWSMVLAQQARKTVHRNPNSRNNRLLNWNIQFN